MLKREMAGAFERWADMVQESKEMKFKLRKFFLRMMNKQISDAFAEWYVPATYLASYQLEPDVLST